MNARPPADQGGFSLIELIVALVILSVGLLSMAATTGYVATQVRVGDLRTERAAALHSVIETLRSEPFTNVNTVDEASAVAVGDFEFWWTVNSPSNQLKQVEIYSKTSRALPGAGSHYATARDTFFFSLAR